MVTTEGDDPINWTPLQVAAWLDGLGLGGHKALFLLHKVDGRALLSLDKEELRDDLCVNSLGDRRTILSLRDALIHRRRRRRTPAAGGDGACAACGGRFDDDDAGDGGDNDDVPVMLLLPGADAPACVHARCRAGWARRHARPCAQCALPVTTAAAILTYAGGDDVTVHPGCADAYEERRRPRGVGGRTAAAALPPALPLQRLSGGALVVGRCEFCRRGFQSEENVVLLTLPGAARAAELHEACKERWCWLHAKRCAACEKPIVRDLQTLSGAWGEAVLHPECSARFQRQQVSGGGGGGAGFAAARAAGRLLRLPPALDGCGWEGSSSGSGGGGGGGGARRILTPLSAESSLKSWTIEVMPPDAS